MKRKQLTTAVFETLPERRLLSAALSGQQLVVTGTDAGDHVMISIDAADSTKLDVNINGDVQSFDRSAVTSIMVTGGAGRDQIVIDESNGEIALPATLIGNGGADLLIGGSGDDVIYGGAGRDRIAGGNGNDLIFGGSGRDQISGGDGADTIVAGRGDDAVDAGAGDDSIIGGMGDDNINGGDGNDAVSGGGDYDSIVGGAGDDTLSGGKGDDDIDGGVGADVSTGGAGDDAFAVADNNSDDIVDKTGGADRVYTPVGLDFIPTQFHDLFAETFPNSVPVGVRVNDDHTFIMLYRYNGDGTVYHAYFTYTGAHPFETTDQAHDGVELMSYEVAPDNMPAETRAQFNTDHPDAVIKEVFSENDGNGSGRFAVIRYTTGSGESKVANEWWVDSGDN